MKYSYKTDLHGHSYFSDGRCSPKEIANIASEVGIDVIALTDHNLTFGINEFENAINELNKDGKDIIGIPGIEVTTEYGHIIFLFENGRDVKKFAETIHIEEVNNFETVIKNSSKYNNYKIIPHMEIPYIGSFSFESVSKILKDFPLEMLHTGLEAINGESQVMPKFLLRKHNTLHKENIKGGWNKNLFANSDYHSKHGIGVGITILESDKKITNAKEFIKLLKTSNGGKLKINKVLSKKELLTEYKYIIGGTIRKRAALILGLPRFRKI